MSLGLRAGRAMAAIFGNGAAVDLSAVNAGAERIDWAGYYQFLRLLYDNNRLYEELAARRERIGDATAHDHESKTVCATCGEDWPCQHEYTRTLIEALRIDLGELAEKVEHEYASVEDALAVQKKWDLG